MKTMTCRQLGGPCNLEHQGETADDIIKANDRHLKEAEKAGDASHQPARDAMKGRWRHPKKSIGWYRDVKQAFAALPELNHTDRPGPTRERESRAHKEH